MQRRATAGVAGAAGLLVLGVLAGCGVGPEDGATRLPDAEVPFDLLVRSETTVPAPDPAAEVAALYFVDGDRLDRRLIHEGVSLDRSDQGRDAGDALFDFLQEVGSQVSAVEPGKNRAEPICGDILEMFLQIVQGES